LGGGGDGFGWEFIWAGLGGVAEGRGVCCGGGGWGSPTNKSAGEKSVTFLISMVDFDLLRLNEGSKHF